MPLNDEVKAVLGDKFTQDALVEMLTPDFQTKLAETHIIRTKDEDDSYVSSRAKELKDQEIGSYVNQLHQKYEDDIFELTGLRKKPTEKAHEFNKRIVRELKIKADGAGGDESLKAQIQTLTETLTQKEQEHESAITTLKESAFKKQLKSVIGSEFNKVTIAVPAHLKTDAEKQTYINKQKSLLEADFLATYTPKEDNEGNIVYYQGDKLMNSTQDGKPLSAEQIISANYSAYFDVTVNRQGGAGSGQGGSQGGTFSTTEDVYKHLESKGMVRLTGEFNKEAAKLIKEHGIIK